jgi:hypothetical protein
MRSVGLTLTLAYHFTRMSGKSYRGLEEKTWLTSLIVLVGGG